ncbi:helix-turn-helix domain-containing protein [Streptomyces sp. NPDC090106]|uniref:helix-turn-helix domain-containing protein n=1 Tax=Streptomyces sp. NPDC090106 TaxID=3365946 RepID=UPI00381C1900
MTLSTRPPRPMPSHPRRRDGKTPLPLPEECARLRRAWGMSVADVATAFGVTAATVRSWEAGRTAPTGLRRAAYAAFLGGLSQGLVPAPGRAAPARPRGTVGGGPAPVPPPRPVTVRPGLPVGPGPDPVTPGRRRRLRVLALAAGAWTVFVHLMTTMPVPHP